MVDLPEIPNVIPQVRAPQSRISGADIAAPYVELGNNLNKIGEIAEDTAENLARRAGQDAVSDDGRTITKPTIPIIGAASAEFSRAARFTALNRMTPEIENHIAELRLQFPYDPQGFQRAVAAYKNSYLNGDEDKGLSPITDPALRGPVEQTILRRGAEGYRSVLTETNTANVKDFVDTSQRRLAVINDESAALARAGNSNTPRYQELAQNREAIYDELVNDKRVGFSRERADLELDQNKNTDMAQAALGHVDRTYKEKGYAAAVQEAQGILTDPNLSLTPAQRQSYAGHAMGEIRANEAIRHQDISEVRTGLRELETASTLGVRIDPGEIENLRQQAKNANWPAGVAMIDAAFAHKSLNDGYGLQPLWKQTQDLNTIKGAAAAKSAYQFFTDKGYRPEEAAGIVGNLIHESGVNPNLPGDQGTSLGLAQFHGERLTALQSFAASRGKPATDFQTQLEFIDKELHGSEAPTLAKLQAAKTPEEAAAAFINYERPAGWTAQNPAGGLGYQSRQAMARSVFQGMPTDGRGGPGVASWLIANRTNDLSTDARKEWKGIMSDFAAGKGGFPSQERINGVIDAARSANDVDLLATVARDADVIDKVQRISQLPLGQQGALELELRRRLASGSADPGAELIEKQLLARTTAIQEGLRENPIATTVANFPDKVKTPNELDFSNPRALVDGLRARSQIAQVAAAQWQTGPLSALDSQEVQQAKAALANPDPAVKAGIYSAIATLPEETRNATLAKIGRDSQQMAVGAGAGSLMSSAPEIAKSIFRGQQAIDMDKGFIPTKGGVEATAFDEKFDKEMPASIFSLAGRTDPTGPYAVAQGMVKARYAYLSAQAADTTGKFDKDRLHNAINDITGGILEHNGGQIVAPARGMPQAVFDRVMYGLTDADLGGATTPAGEPISADYLRNRATLESVADGKYTVRVGKAPPVYAIQGANTEAPRKFVLDLRNRQQGNAPVTADMNLPPP